MAVRAQGPIIDLKDGKIEGKFYHTKKGIETQYFLGVPYAKPPIGNLRFQKPVPLDRWHDVKVCRKFAPRAIQKNDPFEQNGGIPDSENCLYLNIFGPQNASNNKKLYPVIMFIHGGSCVNGSPVAYGDTNIC
uniref:Carboxylesterase type B domain-containing protein n=1 Tax=Acrobeloides nanus TaxID=290746 RepID=A0A914DA26_9BILA